MSRMTTTLTHWIRILPTGERQIWQTMKTDAEDHLTQVMCRSVCPARTWWAPLTDDALLASVAGLTPVEPCLCVTVKDVDGVLRPPEVVNMSNGDNGRPFMAHFSWTVGLAWDPPVEARDVDGRVCLFIGGKKIATAPPGMSSENAMRELRLTRY